MKSPAAILRRLARIKYIRNLRALWRNQASLRKRTHLREDPSRRVFRPVNKQAYRTYMFKQRFSIK